MFCWISFSDLALHMIIMSEDYKQLGISSNNYDLYDEFESGKNIELEKLANLKIYMAYPFRIYNGQNVAPTPSAKKK